MHAQASKYFVVFEKEITYWEKTLSHISETIEIILQVQRNWMYLENIFIGSEDIRKQLPQVGHCGNAGEGSACWPYCGRVTALFHA